MFAPRPTGTDVDEQRLLFGAYRRAVCVGPPSDLDCATFRRLVEKEITQILGGPMPANPSPTTWVVAASQVSERLMRDNIRIYRGALALRHEAEARIARDHRAPPALGSERVDTEIVPGARVIWSEQGSNAAPPDSIWFVTHADAITATLAFGARPPRPDARVTYARVRDLRIATAREIADFRRAATARIAAKPVPNSAF